MPYGMSLVLRLNVCRDKFLSNLSVGFRFALHWGWRNIFSGAKGFDWWVIVLVA